MKTGTGLVGNELPIDWMEPKAFIRRNDDDWRRMQFFNANEEATQRSIAISVKRIADVLELWWERENAR